MSDDLNKTENAQTAAEGDAEFVALTEEQKAARKRRNRAIALGLFVFVGLIFVTTMVRLAGNYNAGG
ncbi:hypothetical protein [Oceanicaulis sp. MMSF_3324]|uniref:hypothetical protein n=1 Tax=Oceanicaulis sp. MMSF_3324 TaxID=3046702 RepID=UPI00273F085A|nr:hypothetical protein [Oceanicaulis sp. MMSF_3324]